ncbi:hypothetical protein BN1708_003957 [Verticillium longisporum]|uniref:Uncharacterized protein n=1 Tax=Verticillium longisporum TaxID=100787 RepID=A0A0G4LTS4_VERLO|nr:hypothetical protein BN1708_003957 [Verticillium longisporum]
MEGSVEPFPLLNTSADPVVDTTAARRRRKSSALGQDIRAGDTGAPALASSRQSLSAVDRPSPSPSISSASSSNNTAMTSSSPAEPSAQTAARRISKRRRARGLLARARQAMIKRTYLLPAVILTIFGFLYALNPTESNPVHRFIFLSYRLDHGSGHPLAPTDPDTPVQYGKGPRDIALVAFYTVVLSFTREYIMQELIRPLARRAGLRSRAKQARFMEQMYTAIYFFFLGPAGMYYKCRISQVITLGLLSFLQALNLFWLFFIVRIAYRFLRDSKATDDRSEDEDDELEELDEDEKKKLIEEDKKARAANKVTEKTATNGASR